MFPLLETPDERRPATQQRPSAGLRTRAARHTAAPSARERVRRAVDLFLALVSLDALRLPERDDDLPVHPHRRPADVGLPARRAGMPPRPEQVCVTPRLQARRSRESSAAR